MDKVDTEFRAWRRRLNIKSQTEAAHLIGRSRRQIAAYEADGEIPRVVRLAMLAVELWVGDDRWDHVDDALPALQAELKDMR